MFKDPIHWFPSLAFSNLLAILVLGSYLVDYIVPKAISSRTIGQVTSNRDKGSFFVIQAAGILAVIAAVGCRYLSWAVTPGWVQWEGLAVGVMGITFREWAVITLGRYFSRIVEIEPDHRLVTKGPYRWIRHPAYTGMILFDIGVALALGSWIGSFLAAALIGTATLYRISIEEWVLAESFGTEYEKYAHRTWRLFPGW